MCASRIAPASICAAGFAIPFPAMSGALPCTGSKIAAAGPMFAPGVTPSPPTRPEISSLRMSPNRLVVTITSNCSGRSTSCKAQLSMMRSLAATLPSYCFATPRPTSRKRPLTILRMLALWTMVTCFLPCATAYSNA